MQREEQKISESRCTQSYHLAGVWLCGTPILLLNIAVAEDDHGGMGLSGFKQAFARSVEMSSELHLIKVAQPLTRVVQRMHNGYDEIANAGNGSYFL